MDNFFDILIFLIIIFSVLSPLLKKKKKQQEEARKQAMGQKPGSKALPAEKPETAPQETDVDILKEIEKLFKPETPEADTSFRTVPPKTSSEHFEDSEWHEPTPSEHFEDAEWHKPTPSEHSEDSEWHKPTTSEHFESAEWHEPTSSEHKYEDKWEKKRKELEAYSNEVERKTKEKAEKFETSAYDVKSEKISLSSKLREELAKPDSLRKFIITSEILGKPKALRRR